MAISWTAFATMFVAAVYWMYELFRGFKARRRGVHHKKYIDRPSMEERSSVRA
jgi:hypothetical protein